MNNNVQVSICRVIDVIQKGTSGVITLPANPSIDAVAAATALYLALLKLGKSVTLSSSTKPTYNLTAVDKIRSQLSTNGDNLVISFPYQEGAVDNVDYKIQGAKFNLIITPRQGYPKLNPQQVNYSYTGGNFDFIIVIDAPALNSLGSLYSENEKQFQGKDIVNIDRHLTNSNYGTVNYVNKTSSSISEMVLKLVQMLGVELDRDIATNLYSCIASSTNNFSSYSVTADTFENVAHLLRLGAVKKMLPKQPPARGFPPQTQMGGGFASPQTQFSPQPQVNPMNHVTPIEQVEQEPKGPPQTPQDWLKPKIFKSGGGLV